MGFQGGKRASILLRVRGLGRGVLVPLIVPCLSLSFLPFLFLLRYFLLLSCCRDVDLGRQTPDSWAHPSRVISPLGPRTLLLCRRRALQRCQRHGSENRCERLGGGIHWEDGHWAEWRVMTAKRVEDALGDRGPERVWRKWQRGRRVVEGWGRMVSRGT